MIQKLTDRVIHSPALVLVAVLCLTVFAGASLVDRSGDVQLRIDPSVDRLLPAADRDRRYLSEMQELFGGDGAIIAAVDVEDAFSADTAAGIQRVSDALVQLPGVRQVFSLAHAPVARGSGLDLEINAATRMLERFPDESEIIRRQVIEDPLFRGTIVSADASTAAFVIIPMPMSDEELLESDLVGQLRQVISKQGGFERIWITGSPVVKVATTVALVTELATTIPAIVGIVALFLVLAFRSGRAVLLPVLTISLAMIWTLGTLAWLEIPLNLVTSIVPPVIITLGLAYAMHVLSEYFASYEENCDNAVEATLQHVSVPLTITGLTTCAGFMALYINPIPAVREFAWLSALGVFFTVLLNLTFLPAALQLVGCGRIHHPPGEKLFDRMARLLAAFDVRRRVTVMVAGAVLFLVSMVGVFLIEVNTAYVGSFSEESQVHRDYTAINERLGGANVFSVVINGQVDDAFIQPDNLRALQRFQDWLNDQPEVGGSTSLNDHLRAINRSLNDGEWGYHRLPESARATRQLLVFGGGDELSSVVDKRFRRTRIIVRARVEDSKSVGNLVERIDEQLRRLPEPLVGQATGDSVLISRTVDEIAGGQMISIGIALAVVWVMLSLLFTSRRIGLLAMLPNLLPVVVYFGALGWSGVGLNPTTSLIACIVLGIAVDDTIHFLARFNADAREQASEERAVYTALRSVLRPITFTSVALVAGFMVLTTSELQNQVQFGALAAFTMAVAWLVDVTFTPAVGSSVRIVTLWDILRLDLGDDPQSSIPLFRGLSNRQARIFALMSNIMNLTGGTRVITEGEDASDIYVLVDGSMEVWVERDGERRALNTLGRGATLGEVGYFDQKRTANVDADSDVRLLRFNAADLEHLRRRYPKIAAVVYRNLNLIQAERLARTTAMVR